MAALPCLLLILGVSTVTAVNIVANDKTDGIVRREHATAHVHSDGEMEIEETPLRHKDVDLSKTSVITDCDRQFMMMAEGTDVCTGSGFPQMVLYEGDCKLAAADLSLTVAPNPDFFLNSHEVNPLQYPHGCYFNTTTNLVSFNPTESNSTTIIGKKICMRTKYIEGTANTDPATGCTGDAKPVTTETECWEATKCEMGGGACKLLDFLENRSVSIPDKPEGCYKDQIGCWGFNNATPAGAIVNGTPVCKNLVHVVGAGDAASAPAVAAADATTAE